MKRKDRPKLIIAGESAIINGEEIEIDPLDPKFSDLQDRCKLAVAEMTTGLKHKLVDGDS